VAFSKKNPLWDDPEWLKLRTRLIAERGGRCQSCRKAPTAGNPLNIHHGYYRPATRPWKYEDETLWVLCWSCHQRVQMVLTEIHLTVGRLHPDDYQVLLKKLPDAISVAQYGLTAEDIQEVLAEARPERATPYSGYRIELMACNDLGPSLAPQVREKAEALFPGLDVEISYHERNPDCQASVSGPDADVCSHIRLWVERFQS
jgi:hypothetical protein